MNFKTLLLSGLVISSGSLMAQDVATTADQAVMKRMLPNSYGRAEAYNEVEVPADKDSSGKAGVKAIIGSKFFDQRMDFRVTLGAHKPNNTAAVSSSEVMVDTAINAYNYNDKLVSLDPYAKLEVPTQADQKATNGRFGAVVSSTYNMPTDAGVFGIKGFIDSAAVFSRKPDKVLVTRDGKPVSNKELALTGLGLTTNEDGNYVTDPQNLRMRHVAGFTLGYEPSYRYLTGLSLAATTRLRLDATPTMEYREEDNVVGAKTNTLGFQSYDYNNDKSAEILEAKYKINDTFYVQNEFTVYLKQVNDKNSYENTIGVGANLF